MCNEYNMNYCKCGDVKRFVDDRCLSCEKKLGRKK